MKVALTGAKGFVGSHVLSALQKSGHDVVALVRNDADADTVAAAGAMPAVVDLYDRPAVVGLLTDAEGAIHTASPGDATSANLDAAVVTPTTSPRARRRSPPRWPAPSFVVLAVIYVGWTQAGLGGECGTELGIFGYGGE